MNRQRPPGCSKHARTYIGVNVKRDGEALAVPFSHTVTVSTTKTPAWILKDRRRAANKRARAARKAGRR